MATKILDEIWRVWYDVEILSAEANLKIERSGPQSQQ